MPAKTKKGRPPTHRQTKDYLKAYLPYLPLITLLVGIFALLAMPLRNGSTLSAATSITKASLLAETNEERTRGEMTALGENSLISLAAQTKAEDMASKDYWSHDTPENLAPWSFLDAVGYSYSAAGENLAFGFADADQTIAGWLNSETHRHNMLNRNYTEAGFGVASSPNYQGAGPATIVVAMYAAPASATGILGLAEVSYPASQKISLLQTFTKGYAPWLGSGLVLTALLLVSFLVIRRHRSLRRKLLRTEKLILSHPLVDATVIAFTIFAALLSRTAGFIR